MKYAQVFTFLTILIVGTSCNGQDEKGLPKEKVEHPKLIKNIGNPRYGNVQCGIQDKNGNLWFGTTQNGLYKYDGKTFRQFLVTDGLNSNNITCILEDKDGKIWVGTDSGLCLYDPRPTSSFGQARLIDSFGQARPAAPAGSGGNDSVGRGKTFTKVQIPLPKNLPPNKNRNTHDVFSIMQAKSGKLWVATIDGVYIYDARLKDSVGQGSSLPTGQAGFTHFIIDENAMGYMSTNNNAEHILEDKAGNIWFGGRGVTGVYRYDGKSVTNIKLKELFQDGPKPKAHNWAWPQLQDKNGNIWFSNWGGVYRYDGKSFTSYTSKDGLSGDMVARITEDKKGNIWFGGAGLSRYNASPNDEVGRGKSFTRFTTKDGLPNVGVWLILEDKTGNIWVGTRETGLYLYDGKAFNVYSEYKQ